MSGFHRAWAWVTIVGNGTAGLWALAAARWVRLRRPALWWFTGAAEMAIFVQVGQGVAMVAGRDDLRDLQFHMFYGFIALAAVGIIYSYRQQLRHRLYLLYGLGGLFVMGLCLRALQIGPR